jgi:hypothetical protein
MAVSVCLIELTKINRECRFFMSRLYANGARRQTC